MTIFDNLASTLENAWRKEQNNLSFFTNLATLTLSDLDYNWSIEQLHDELNRWLLKTPQMPEQMSFHNNFGQPSLTLFNNGQFVVDLYFWLDFDTSIHSHGFRGAFRILHGKSLQETFNVSKFETVSEDIRIVDLNQVDYKILHKDDVETIQPGLEFSHRVIHLSKPTVTLCLKTINEPNIKQWNYLPTGFAMQRQTMSVELAKNLYFYQYLLSIKNLKAELFLKSFLSKLDISTQILVYETAANGALDFSEETMTRIAETIVGLHEKSKWWPYYEKAHLDALDDISFKEYHRPIERLVAHFANCGHDLNIISKLTNASINEIELILNQLRLGHDA